jgi:hypothetical protein
VAAKNAPAWVKVLVVFHVCCITIWSCPKPDNAIMEGKVSPYGFGWIRYWDQKYLKGDPELNPPAWDVQAVCDPVQLYLFTTGAWQYWDMFSPNPADTDWYGDAVVHYKDGTHRVYQYPRMALLPIPEKYLKERYRKFYERAHDDNYQYLFPLFGLRVALLNYSNPSNPPVQVDLRRHWLTIAAPGKPQDKNYSQYTYFTYEVDQKLLKEMLRKSH